MLIARNAATNVTVHLAIDSSPLDAIRGMLPASVALTAFRSPYPKYTPVAWFITDKTGSDAAEEVFALTNDPSRQDERAYHYGEMRSVSVGDIIEVGDDLYLCQPCGWEML